MCVYLIGMYQKRALVKRKNKFRKIFKKRRRKKKRRKCKTLLSACSELDNNTCTHVHANIFNYIHVHVISEPEQLPVYATHEEAKQAFKELLKEKVCGIVHTCTCSTVCSTVCSIMYCSVYMYVHVVQYSM